MNTADLPFTPFKFCFQLAVPNNIFARMNWQGINRSPRTYRIATTIFFFISGFGYSTWASRIPAFKQMLHLNDAELGYLLLAAPVGVLLTVPFTGKLLGVYSSKSITLFGAVFYNIVLLLLAFATQTWQLAVILFLFGSSRNLLNLSMNAQAAEIQSLYGKSIMTSFHGLWSMAGFAGAAVGYFFTTLIASAATSLYYHFLLVSIVLMITSLLCYPYLFYKQHAARPKKPLFSLPDKHLLKFSLIAFASMACENVMYDWSGIYFQKVIGVGKGAATAAFVVYMIAMTTGRLAGDKVVNKIGIIPILKYSGLLICSGLLIAVLLPFNATALVGFVMIGFGVSCIVPLVFSLAGQSTQTSSGAAIASVSTVGYFGFLVVPPSVGFISHQAGLQWSFGIISLFGLVIFFLVLSIRQSTYISIDKKNI